MDKLKCPYCGIEYSKKGIGTHIWRNHARGKDHDPNSGFKNGERKIWNKGLSKENHESIRKQAEKISGKPSGNKGVKMSAEQKEKISSIRREYLEKNPDKVPYRLNHSSKMSYPEKIFRDELIRRGIEGWIYNYPVGIYQYDFAWPKQKIDIEIDGATHLQEKVKKIDERRDIWSKNNGWKVIRFRAKDIKENVSICVDRIDDLLK